MQYFYNKNVYIISILSRVMIVALTFASSVLISRYLGPELKGQYSYIFNFVAILALILNMGVGQSYTFFKKKNGEGIRQEFLSIYYFQLLIYLFIILLINIFYTNYILNIIMIASVITQFNSQINFMATVSDINKRNINNVYAILLQVIFLSMVYILSDENLSLVILAVFLRLIFNTISLIIQNNLLPSKLFSKPQLLKEIIKFGIFPMITSLLITLNYNLDIIILRVYVDFSQIGIYSIGVALATMLWVIPDAFKDVLFNKTSKGDAIPDIVFSIKFNLYICIFIILGFLVFGQLFISVFYGTEFIDAYSVTFLLFLGAIPMVFFKMINTLYISIGKQRFAFFILLTSVIVNIILNFYLIPILGIEGAAIASIGSYFICGFIFLFTFMKSYKVRVGQLILLNEEEKVKLKKIFRRN